jgi:hypothetical protein
MPPKCQRSKPTQGGTFAKPTVHQQPVSGESDKWFGELFQGLGDHRHGVPRCGLWTFFIEHRKSIK